MKKYTAPELKALAFIANEQISGQPEPLPGSKLENDGEFAGW